MSGFPAARYKLRGRGVLKAGNFADITIFDPDTVTDRATFDQTHRLSVGISDVIVNGTPILAGGKPILGVHPGRYLRYNSGA